ncbi:hypothetical protein ACFE04_021448 [Oxalis oulophora]
MEAWLLLDVKGDDSSLLLLSPSVQPIPPSISYFTNLGSLSIEAYVSQRELILGLEHSVNAPKRSYKVNKVSLKFLYLASGCFVAKQAYIGRKPKLQKVFVFVKGIYYQAEIDGQKIMWLTPHAFQQVLTDDALLYFINFKLYHSINVKYPTVLDAIVFAYGSTGRSRGTKEKDDSGLLMIQV